MPTPPNSFLPPQHSQKPVGVVLAGGKSSRLGFDKATIYLEQEQCTVLEHSARLLQNLLGRVCIIGRVHPDFECVPDAIPHLGPVGAIATALAYAKGPVFALPCDLPFMRPVTLERLLRLRNQRPEKILMTSYQHLKNRHIETLVSIYEPEALPLFLDRVEKRLLKIALIVPQDQHLYLPYEDDCQRDFENINFPADVARMQAAGLLRPHA